MAVQSQPQLPLSSNRKAMSSSSLSDNNSPRCNSPRMVDAARRALDAAETAHKAATADEETSKALLALTQKAFEEATLVCDLVQRGSRRRQTVAEFTTMLKEEAQEQVNEKVDEVKRYAERNIRKAYSLIEDHWKIDEAFRMLGPLRQDSNLARDVHDAFNLVALLPVIYLNLLNWVSTSLLLDTRVEGASPNIFNTKLPALWHGEVFLAFWWLTFGYFITDLLFVVLLPKCVKSPGVIVSHHIATIGYICVPFLMPEYGWLMGACMLVEVNTWFLISRRFFNKSGDKMFTTGLPLRKSLRLLLVSSCFYTTWFVIRLGFYPYLLIVIVGEWLKHSSRVGSYINLIALTPIMQTVFIYLNVKWSVDLIRSKLKGRGASKGL